LLDIGCGNGELIRSLSGHIGRAVGIDPELVRPVTGIGYELVPGRVPDDLPAAQFDVVTMLAVLEHLPPKIQADLADQLWRLLNPDGRIIITVPSPRVDDILHGLQRLHLIAGIGVHEHWGFDPAVTPGLFPTPRYLLRRRSPFQLGFNNLFVFEKTALGADG
jgi:2-polyprenyl-3-methyl-5-hydroxy-6-metoxy-1,4-benzoquinol methylase